MKKIEAYINKHKKEISLIGAIMIILSVYGVFYVEAANADYYEGEEGGGGGGSVSSGPKTYKDTVSGHLQEQQSDNYDFNTSGFVTNATFTLTWKDEPDEVGCENDGDTFELKVISPDGEVKSQEAKNEHGQEGRIVIEFPYSGEDLYGPWNVTVTLRDAGEQWILGLGIVGFTDDSNDYTLTVEMDYYVE